MTMKRIAFVMPWFLPMPPVRGGAVETLVDALLRQNERAERYQITVFSTCDEIARAAWPAYRMTRFIPVAVSQWEDRLAGLARSVLWKGFRYGITPGMAYLRAVLRAMKGQTFDRIVVENQAPFAAPISRMGIGPVDLHMHNVAILNEQPHPERTGECCRRMIAVSDYISDWTKEHLGSSDTQRRVLLNCVDTLRFAEGRRFRADMRKQLGMEEGEIVFLYTGRLCREKGGLELARAFVQAGLPGARLVIVGSGWFGGSQESEYQRQIQAVLMPVRDRVIFTGFVRYADMPRYYAAADVAVLPSVWDEPSGLTVLEAQAAGLPLITTLSGGIPQNVCPEGAVLLERGEDLVDQIARHMVMLANDRERRERMSRAALQWSRGRNEGAYFDAFCALMEEA